MKATAITGIAFSIAIATISHKIVKIVITAEVLIALIVVVMRYRITVMMEIAHIIVQPHNAFK
jgi:hypothetical protein